MINDVKIVLLNWKIDSNYSLGRIKNVHPYNCTMNSKGQIHDKL